MVKVEEAEVEVARTDEATSATARAAAVWAAARVVLSVAEVMVLVGMAAMRVAAVAAFKKDVLCRQTRPMTRPPQRERKKVSRRHRRVTTAVGEKRHCCGTRQIANRGGGEEGKTLSRSHKRSFLRQDHNLGHALAL